MVQQRSGGHFLGLHRVVGESGILPQAAARLDASLPIYDNEVKLAVDVLQIDSASFRQLQEASADMSVLAERMAQIVSERGKMQNPVTGSGGMLLGTVAEIGVHFPGGLWHIGDRVATLVSLTATPLQLEGIHEIDLARERVKVSGHAILFPSHLAARIPPDLPEMAVLAALDICGAPALVTRMARRGDTVFVLGLGKAARAAIAALRQRLGHDVKIIGADASPKAVAASGEIDRGLYTVLDATSPVAVMDWVLKSTSGRGADFSINLTNVAGSEMATILSTRDGGRCLFFGMATSFQKATLGAESVGRDVQLIMGNGYSQGHAEFMINLLRTDERLLKYFSGGDPC